MPPEIDAPCSSAVDAVTPRLDADELHTVEPDEPGEDADRVRAAADARDDDVRKRAGAFEDLLSCFVADHVLQLLHHPRERMRTDDRADHVVRRLDVRDPVAERLVDRVLQRAAPGVDGDDLGPQHLHAEHVESLALHVGGAHVHDALEPEERGARRRRDAVLSGARLGDHAVLPETLRKQALSQDVVDLVRAGVHQVFALHPHRRADALAQSLRAIQRRRTSAVVAPVGVELGKERRVFAKRPPRFLELEQGGHQHLWCIPSAVRAEASVVVRTDIERLRHDRAAFTNAFSLSASLIPGSLSTPDDTSTPAGHRRAIAFGDVVGTQATGQHERHRRTVRFDHVPRRDDAGPAELSFDVRVEVHRNALQTLDLDEVGSRLAHEPFAGRQRRRGGTVRRRASPGTAHRRERDAAISPTSLGAESSKTPNAATSGGMAARISSA